MSKEIEFEQGNLYASFDLENTDGDLDCCKLFKTTHGITTEIGFYVDFYKTNEIIKEQSQRMSELEEKLKQAEETKDYYIVNYDYIVDKLQNEKKELQERCKELEEENQTIKGNMDSCFDALNKSYQQLADCKKNLVEKIRDRMQNIEFNSDLDFKSMIAILDSLLEGESK